MGGSTNSAPAQGNTNWQIVGAYNNYQGVWSSTATYYAGQETTYSGNYWIATATNTNSVPSTSNVNWVLAGPQNLDKIADGSIRLATIQQSHSVGAQVVDNATFQGAYTNGWSAVGASAYMQSSGPAPAVGGQYVVVQASASPGYIQSNRTYSCNPGDSVAVGGLAYCVNGTAQISVAFFTSAGAYISSIIASSTTAAWKAIQASGTVPANAAFFRLDCIQTTSGDFACFNYVWCSVNDLRVAGSGAQIGDQRNLQGITWASVRSVLSTSPLTYTITSGSPSSTINFSCAAVTLYGGSFSLSYNAATASHTQANGTTQNWYCYFVDPAYVGGTQPLGASTSLQAVSQINGAVFLGICTVTTSSGGGGSGGGGSGGGGYCVADDMFIGEGRHAGDAEIGDQFDCIDLPTHAGKHVRALQGVSRGTEECVRMITSDGCALVCSVSTPFDLPDGRSTTATQMLGEQVITDLGTATVTSLALVGPRPVTRAHLGGVSYAAGADPQRRIYSHNAGTSKP